MNSDIYYKILAYFYHKSQKKYTSSKRYFELKKYFDLLHF